MPETESSGDMGTILKFRKGCHRVYGEHTCSTGPRVANFIQLGQRGRKVSTHETSLVVQWLRTHLLMQGTWVWSLILEDPTCHGATKPVHDNNWVCVPSKILQAATKAWRSQRKKDSPESKQNKTGNNPLVLIKKKIHSSTLAWKIPWTEEPGGLQSMGSLRVGHDWATSLSLFTFLHWRRKWQPTPVFLPGESQGRGSLVGCRLWGCTESDTTEAT